MQYHHHDIEDGVCLRHEELGVCVQSRNTVNELGAVRDDKILLSLLDYHLDIDFLS